MTRRLLVLNTLVATGLLLGQTTMAAQTGGFEVRTLSARANMVSNGDVLIQIDAPASAGTNVVIAVNGSAPHAELRPGTPATRLIVRLKDLKIGANLIEVGVKGQKPAARLAVINHPISGPVMSGPRQMPFTCETQVFGFGQPLDADCSVATRVDYFYRARGQDGNPFKPYDRAASRPTDLTMTTTIDGKTVPYIVRREIGTINRAVYTIAFLHEPGTPLPDPWTAGGTSWNGRLIYSFGAGCQAGYHQGRNLGGLLANRSFLEESQLADAGIAKGYAVASSTLNAFGTTCSDVISAETMMMVKEHFIEQFGVPRYTIGSGRSGGSMQQQLIANNYPGLLDGLIPTASFPDTLTFITHFADCELLDEAFEASALPWTDAQKAAVAGEANWQFCQRNGTGFPVLRPGYCDRTAVPAEQVYDARSNAKGARCTYQDNMVNIFGRDPKTGFARRPIDNVGVQYGLKPFNDGTITFEQFVDINRRVGGHDIDGRVVPSRTSADPEALRIAYQSGRVNDTSRGMAAVPIIDVRPYTDGTGDVHDIVNGYLTRARLMAANGTSGNQVFHVYAPGIFMDRVQPANLDEMEAWLAAIEKDTAPSRNALEKVIRNKPATVTDACYTRDGEKITDPQRCAQLFPVYANPRLVAGQPLSATTLKCALKPVRATDYVARLTEAQVAAIKTVFPSGVCDYTKPGPATRAPDVWLSYGVSN